MQQEKRNAVRKALVARGDLKQGRRPPAPIDVINVARDGMAIFVRQKIIEGAPCVVKFTMTVDGTSHQLALQARAMFCVYAGLGAYKAGLQFIDMDADTHRVITHFLDS